jgi:hypothetical protein
MEPPVPRDDDGSGKRSLNTWIKLLEAIITVNIARGVDIHRRVGIDVMV